jgi:hypothetical protein
MPFSIGDCGVIGVGHSACGRDTLIPFTAKECDLYHTLRVPGADRLSSLMPLMPSLRLIKIIVQRLSRSDSSAPSFKLVAYDVDTASVYRPVQFRSAEELLAAMSPIAAELVEAWKSVPDWPGATIVFDQILRISEAQLSVLGLRGRHSEGP